MRGLVRQVVQADAFFLCQRVAVGDHQHVLPFIAGQGDELRGSRPGIRWPCRSRPPRR